MRRVQVWLHVGALLILLAKVAAAHVSIPITVSVHGVEQRPCTLRLIPSTEPNETRTIELIAPSEVTVELPQGSVWTIEASGDGLWSDSAIVVPRVDVAEQAVLDLWSVGVVQATIEVEENEELPEHLRVRFSLPEGADPERGFPEDEVRCPIEDGRLHCELPAGTVDLRLRAEGMISHFRWDLSIKPSVTDLGTLRLQRGASVTGWVVAAQGRPDLSKAELALEPLGLEPDAPRISTVVLTERPNAKGFFHFTGIAPGSYRLEVSLDDVGKARFFPLTVMENAESAIAEPIVLHPPATLFIELDPPKDPWSRPWRLSLSRMAASGNLSFAVDGLEPVADGSWKHEKLEHGGYEIEVEDVSGNRWWYQELRVSAATELIRIEMPMIEVRGQVLHGEEPLEAVVLMGGRNGSPRIRMDSDDTGVFSGVLPKEGAWIITVLADKGRLERNFTMVPIRAENGLAEVELVIPRTRIEGVVVDERGKPMEAVLVDIASHSITELPLTVISDKTGAFEASGMAEGTAVLEASKGELKSDPVTVEVDSTDAQQVRLVLSDMRMVTGTVHSQLGGVPGATVILQPIGRRNSSGQSMVSTELDGSFEVRVPRWVNQAHVHVMAPGFALQVFRADIDPDIPLSIPVNQTSGRLVLEQGQAYASGRMPVLLHRGSLVSPALLWHWLQISGLADSFGERLEVPGIEPGEYVYCEFSLDDLRALGNSGFGDFSGGRCGSAMVLVPGGELIVGGSGKQETKS